MGRLNKRDSELLMAGLMGRAQIMTASLKSEDCDFGCTTAAAKVVVDHCQECPVRDMAVCSSLHDDELASLSKFMSGQKISQGHDLFAEGDPAKSVFTVTEGVVKAHKLMPDGRRQIIGFFFAGDFVGLAHGDTCSYSAEAAGPIRVCRFERQRFEKVLDEFPKMRGRLLSDASDELAAAHNQMLLLGRKTARERLATFLLMVDDRTADWREETNLLQLTMTRSDIADYLGLTTETVSRTFTQFRKDGLISAQGVQDVVLLDREGLSEVAEG